MTDRRKAAKKAAETRATNRAILKRWREVDEPAFPAHGCDSEHDFASGRYSQIALESSWRYQ
jgi:hypothetical protein